MTDGGGCPNGYEWCPGPEGAAPRPDVEDVEKCSDCSQHGFPDDFGENYRSVLTKWNHDECGSSLYRVGSGRELFCVSCGVKVEDSPLQRVEEKLHDILSELDSEEMDVGDRMEVERACQQIHSCFGGEDPDSIYPE